ncbi:proteasome core particle subunit beta 2 [Conglomerata obtusa]
MLEFRKTGTTIVGVTYANGIILASDTRATSGSSVSDKNIHKLHNITPCIFACGAGTAADTDRVTRYASKELTLFEKKYNKRARVDHCIRLLRNYLHSYGGQIGAALIIAGVDDKGKKLCSVSPHGYYAEVPFTALGSGSLAAMGVLENGYKKDMSRDDAVTLACEAVKAGILNDLYSGSNVDLCVITDDSKVEINRKYLEVSMRENEQKIKKYPAGSLKILKEDVYKLLEEIE